jgi:hypothetical protein
VTALLVIRTSTRMPSWEQTTLSVTPPKVVEEVAPTEASTLLYHGIATTHTERLSSDMAGAV